VVFLNQSSMFKALQTLNFWPQLVHAIIVSFDNYSGEEMVRANWRPLLS